MNALEILPREIVEVEEIPEVDTRRNSGTKVIPEEIPEPESQSHQ